MTASPSGELIRGLFYLYMAIALLVGGLVLGWLAYVLVKYRDRPGMANPRDAPKAGVIPAERGHPLWSYVMAILIAAIMFGLAFGTISAVTTLETPPEDGDRLDVEVQGFTFAWRILIPHESGIVVNRTNDWTLPVDTAIVANVTSIDVWHNFALPAFAVRIDAIPGQTNHLWWKATELGTVQPVCVQLCGSGHAVMRSQLKIVSKEDFRVYFDEAAKADFEKLDKAKNVINATYTASGFEVGEDLSNKARVFAVRVTNNATTTQTFTAPAGRVTLEPGETGFLGFPIEGGQLRASGTETYHTFRSVS